MKLGYTEFSFGYAFTENLIRASRVSTTGAPIFPNLVQEATLGYDVQIGLPAVPLFFQFKLPELMVRRTAREIVDGLPGIQCDFFRMPLMRSSLSSQHENLMRLERKNTGRVFYATPNMNDLRAFNRAYSRVEVHNQSSLFSPLDIGPLPDDAKHHVSYMATGTFGWRCSEPKRVNRVPLETAYDDAKRDFDSDRYRSVEQLSELLAEELVSEIHEAGVDLQGIRSRQQDRVRLIDGAALLDPARRAVAEGLLAARDVARIGLGLEMVVAQPRAEDLE